MRGDGDRTAVLLDRHPLWVDALERLLERIGVTVVGTTSSPATALDLIGQLQPSLFIAEYDCLDAGEGRLSTLREAASRTPSLKSIVLATHDDDAHVDAAFDAGATVFCVKTAEPDDLAAAIRQALTTSIYYAAVRQRRQERERLETPTDAAARSVLTKREVEILRLVAEGHSNSQLAKMLWVTEQTVKFHLSNIYRKLGVANRTEASRWAQLHHLLPPTSGSVSAAA